MKKLLALLLAFLCLAAVPALGEESRSLMVAFTADEAELTACCTALGLPDSSTLAKGLAKLLNSTTLEFCSAGTDTGDQTGKMDLRIGEETLLDFTFRVPADRSCMLMTSSAIPGYAIRAAAEGGELKDFSLSGKPMDTAALEELLTGPVTEKARQWLDGQNSVTSYGDFMGDAYDSGRVCVDLTLEDSDLYVLGMYLKPEMHKAFEVLGTPGEEESLLDGMLRTALENANQYRLRLVYDEDHSLTGISLTAMNNASQVATLSLGYENPEATRFVLGMGLGNRVYYLDGELRTDGQRTGIAGRLYGDPGKAGFPAARADEKNLLQTLALEISAAGTGEDRSWTYSGSVQDREGRTIRESGSVSTAGGQLAWKDSVFLDDHEQPALTVRVRSEASDSTPAWPENLQVVDDLNDERITAAIEESVPGLSAAMIRLVPTELLMYLVNNLGD